MSLNLGIIASSRQQSAPLLLDAYPGAVAAYSFRKLRTAYTGFCCQISDGGTLIDIGFVNNYVDLIAIQNAGPDISIVYWYDQSGNGNDLYRYQDQGGRIKISNVLQTLNGKVAINYINRSASFNNNSINLKNGFCNFTAAQVNSTTQQVYIFSKETSDIVLVASQSSNEWGIARDNVSFIAYQSTKGPTTYTLFTSYYDGLNGAIKSNGIIRGTGVYSNSTTPNTTQFSMPTNIANGSSKDILYTESVFYQSTQLANQTGIEANINSYYSIYPVPPVVSDPDAQAFVNRVFAAGGVVTSTEANAVNTLTIGLKANGIWSLMKVIYPFVGASAAACAQNLKSSSFTATFVNPWTFTSAGIQQFGTSYMNTNFNQQGNWTSTSNGSMGFVSATNEPGGFIIDMGAAANPFNIDNSSAICCSYSGTFFAGINCTSIAPGVSNASTIGFFVTSRLSSTSYSKYKRGSSTINSTNTDAIGSNINAPIYLSANNAPPNATLFSKKLYNFCFIGDGLTQTQVDDYWTLLQTFNTSLGR